MNKVKLLQWLVVLLIALNLSTIISIAYHKQQESADNELIIFNANSESRLNGRYFRHSLGFDNEQMDAFRTANRSFQPKVSAIVFRIDSLKQATFSELKKDHPDKTRLNYLSEEIGLQHATLKKETNEFYIHIKDVCTDSQRAQLNEVFSPLFKNQYEGNPGMRRGRQLQGPTN